MTFNPDRICAGCKFGRDGRTAPDDDWIVWCTKHVEEMCGDEVCPDFEDSGCSVFWR